MIGENIKRIRKEKGLTQKELGKRLGISQSAIGQFENNSSNLKIDTIKKIADALGVTIVELCAGNLNKYKDDIINYYSSDESSDSKRAINYVESQIGLDAARHTIDLLNSLPEEDIAVITPVFGKLNEAGKIKALEQIEMLSKIPEYQKKKEK